MKEEIARFFQADNMLLKNNSSNHISMHLTLNGRVNYLIGYTDSDLGLMDTDSKDLDSDSDGVDSAPALPIFEAVVDLLVANL